MPIKRKNHSDPESTIGNWQSAMIEVINRQRTRKINTRQWHQFGEAALKAMGADHRDATIVFVSDRKIKELNRSYRKKDYATDVLSFPTNPAAFEAENKSNLGDVVISVDRAAAQAKEAGHSFAGDSPWFAAPLRL